MRRNRRRFLRSFGSVASKIEDSPLAGYLIGPPSITAAAADSADPRARYVRMSGARGVRPLPAPPAAPIARLFASFLIVHK
ncbi:hypothetical protein EVAR_61097_1 [Eumeta japonica]|uniref:Uncharacterized protein n=1 Tax=Eumeta variegata TaxID=151549 RepID=A0A4C1YRW9_EUMVA|nr:hypothetical protein EVAR_61097_1 [Eumeta japonica]